MTISRLSFGWVGGIIIALFYGAACLGWSAVNVIVWGELFVALSIGAVRRWVGILIIAILTTFVSLYGYRYVHRYERYAWIPMALIFAIMMVVAAPHFHAVATPAFGAAEIAAFITFGGTIYGFATGWSSYAADYNVNQPENTSSARVFWLTFLGVFIPCVLLETLGLAFTTIIVPASQSLGGGELLDMVVKLLGRFTVLIHLILALSVLSTNTT